MHKIDRLELLANVSELGREARSLLAEAASPRHSARLQRIIVILGYMREHLEMVSAPLKSGDARHLLCETDRETGL